MDNANKAVNGYLGYCGHQPGPNDTLLAEVPDAPGWYQFTLNASEYGQTLGLFYGVVIRRDQGPCFETWFGLSSMTTPNDWANFDWSWDNRLKVDLPRVALDGLVCGEASRTIADLQALPAPANAIASGYVKFQARVTPAATGYHYEWSVSAGSLVAPTAGVGLAAVKWDAPNGHEQAVTLTLTVRESTGGPVVCRGTATLQTIRPYVVRARFVDDYWNEEQQIAPLPENKPEYDAIAGVNHPVCYVMARGLQVEVDIAGAPKADNISNLTKKTPIQVSAMAAYGGIEYPFRPDRSDSDFVDDKTEAWSWPDYGQVVLESLRNVPTRVDLYDTLVLHWTFKVRNSMGQWIVAYRDDGVHSQKTNHGESVAIGSKPPQACGLFTTYDTHRLEQANFASGMLRCACEWARSQRQPRPILQALLDGFNTDYNYVARGNCLFLAKDYWNAACGLGLRSVLHRWDRPNAPAVGNMWKMYPNHFDPAGAMTWADFQTLFGDGTDPLRHGWNFHAFVGSASRIWDPSAHTSNAGSWGRYEDVCFEKYSEITAMSPPTCVWQLNQSGQSRGCEATGVHRTIASPGSFDGPPTGGFPP